MRPSVKRQRRVLSLVKGVERFVFSYHDGQEAQVLASVVALAGDPASPLDWFDAAVLSYQMGRGANVNPEELFAV